MRFKLCAIDSKLAEAIAVTDNLLSPASRFMDEIFHKNNFKYNSGSGKSVYERLISPRLMINVYIAADTRPTKSIAYFQNGNIYLYQSYLDSASVGQLAGTLLHEYAHYCGFNHNSPFGTSNFKTKAKSLYSVPYYLSENVSRWV